MGFHKEYLVSIIVLAVLCVSRADQTVKIFHINDLQYDIFQVKIDGSIDCLPDDTTCFGGLLRLEELVQTEILPEETNTTHLWLNAGNMLGGPNYDVLKFDIATAMHNLSFHASALGPEVFKYGLSPSTIYTDTLNDTIVASNIKHESSISKSVIVPLGGDCYAGIVGFVDKNKTDSMMAHGVEIADEVTSVLAEIEAIKSDFKDSKFLFIALGSATVDMAKKIAELSAVDMVVFSGGDLGDDLKTLNFFEEVNATVDDTTIKTNYIASVVRITDKLESRFLVGTISLTVDDECKITTTDKPILGIVDYLSNNKTENQESKDFLQTKVDELLAMDDTVARSKVNLLPTEDLCKLGECIIGDLIADAMFSKVNYLTADQPWNESVKVAVFPAYLIQNQSDVEDDITPKQLYNFLEKDEYIYTVPLSGAQMKKLFETSIKDTKDKSGKMDYYLQVSEYLHVEFNFDSKEVKTIEAMTELSDTLQLSSIDIHDDKNNVIVVALPSSLLFNTTDFEFLRDNGGIVFYEATVADALVSHISKTSSNFLTLPLLGLRTKEYSHVTEMCVSNTGEVIILTLFVLVLIAAFVIGIWKYVLPKYRTRRGSTTQLIQNSL